MAYCTVQDLETYYLGKQFKCSDYLSNGKADLLISSNAALMDAMLKSKYSLPFTDTNDLLILKMINEGLVVGVIDDIFREKTEDGKFERGRNTRKEAMDLLAKIVSGELELDGSATASAIKFNNLDSNGDEVEKRFKDSNIEPVTIINDRNTHTIQIVS